MCEGRCKPNANVSIKVNALICREVFYRPSTLGDTIVITGRRSFVRNVVSVLIGISAISKLAMAQKETDASGSQDVNLDVIQMKFLVVETLDSEPIASFSVNSHGPFIFSIDEETSLAATINAVEPGTYELVVFDVIDNSVGQRLASMFIGDDTEAVFQHLGLSINFFTKRNNPRG